jgi:hypothetical protein
MVYWRQTLFLSIWLSALGVGFWKLLVYSNTPGVPAEARLQWPPTSTLVRASDLPTLIVFVHPQCACSEATLGELERLQPHIHDKVKSLVVFFKPKHRSEDWVKDQLWTRTMDIPGLQAIIDEDGAEAARFGVHSSGQVFLYDSKGTLVFHGGITSARGHMGDNAGRDAILAFVESGKPKLPATPVFGCTITNPERTLAGNQ